jgi:hypothetical protein
VFLGIVYGLIDTLPTVILLDRFIHPESKHTLMDSVFLFACGLIDVPEIRSAL